MFLKIDHNDAGSNKEYAPIPEGKYEAIIKEAELATSSSGNPMIKVTLIIRDDVQQPAGKRRVWDYLVSSEKAKWKLNQVAKAIKLADGTNVATIQDFVKEILFKPVKITIKHEEDTYNGETKIREKVAFYDVASVGLSSVPTADPFSTPAPTQNSSMPF